MFEGEEEIGSPNLDAFIREHKDLLAADVVISADGAMWRTSEPSLTVATRGIAELEFTLTGAAKDLHSGRHGGGVANPLHAMAQLVASLHHADGRIAVAGFYDTVRELSAEERAAIAALPFDEAAYLAQIGAPAGFGEPGYTLLERQWTRPTLEINGMWGGYEGPGQKTVIPGEAHAKITCRLVPDQDPREVVALITRHLEANVPPGTRLSVTPGDHGTRAGHIATDHFALKAADAALQRGVWRAAADRPHGRDGADHRTVQAQHGARHGLLLLLHRRRGLPRAERVLPRAPPARRARGVGAVLGAARRGARVTHRSARSSPTAEASVEAHSASLKKELGVRDLALTQILFIVGLSWIGVAGKLGPSHVVFWLLALVLFYLPSAVVVMYLNRLMPLEGGLYQWAKLGFNQTVGFMLAWNLWLYVIVFASEIGLQCATYLSYAIGPSAAWMTTSTWFVALCIGGDPLADGRRVDHRTVGGQVGAQRGRRHDARDLRRADPAARARPRDRTPEGVPPVPHGDAVVLALQPEHPRQDRLRRARRVRVHGDPRGRNADRPRDRFGDRCSSPRPSSRSCS